jgi:hypothetical protein
MSSNANLRDDDVSKAIKRQLTGWFDYSGRLGCRETPQSIQRRAQTISVRSRKRPRA